jgi:hypothetical protein
VLTPVYESFKQGLISKTYVPPVKFLARFEIPYCASSEDSGTSLGALMIYVAFMTDQ